MDIVKFFIVLLSIAAVQAAERELPKCCPGENKLKKHDDEYCKTDNQEEIINNLNCSLFRIWEYSVDDSGTMHSNESHLVQIHTKKFCVTKIRCETAMWICYEDELITFVDEVDDEPVILRVIMLLLYATSAILFMVTFLIYAFIPELNDLHGKSTAYHCGCYVVFHGCVIMGVVLEVAIERYWVINVIVYGAMYWFLAAIFWSLNMYLSVIKAAGTFNWKEPDNKTFVKYNIFGWGMPFILVAILIFLREVSEKPGLEWIMSTVMYVLSVTTIMLIINIILFAIACYALYYKMSYQNLTTLKKLRYKFCMYFKLFIVSISTWITLFVFTFASHRVFGIIGGLFVSSQGTLYFLILVVFRKKVRKILETSGYCSTRFCNSGVDEDAQDEVIPNEVVVNQN